MGEEFNLIEAFKAACLKPDPLVKICGLQYQFPTQLDLSLDQNYALNVAVFFGSEYSLGLISYLLADRNVLAYEHDNDYPILRKAIDTKSKFAGKISYAICTKFTDIPEEIMALINSLNLHVPAASAPVEQKNEKEYVTSAVPNSEEKKESVLRFSQFANGVTLIEDYASASGERPRSRLRKLFCLG